MRVAGMWLLRSLLIGIVGLAGGDGAAAGAGCAGDLPSERLALYCALAAMHSGSAGGAEVAVAAAGLGRMGFGGAQPSDATGDGAGAAAVGVTVLPRLIHSDNVNGGNLPRDLWIGTLHLARDPAFDARSGVLVGAELRADWRARLGPGQLIDLAAGVEELVVVGDGARVAGRRASACLGSHLGGWWFADICAAHAATRRELGRQRHDALSAGVVRLWSRGVERYETKVALERHLHGAGQAETRLAVGMLGARAGTAGWARLRLVAGAPQAGTGALRVALGAEMATVVWRRRVALSADYARHAGSVLLGVPLAGEERLAVGARVALGEGVMLDLGWEFARGGVSGGHRATPRVGIELAGWRF